MAWSRRSRSQLMPIAPAGIPPSGDAAAGPLPPSLAPIEILADGRAARIGAHSTRQTPSGFPAVISTPLGNLP